MITGRVIGLIVKIRDIILTILSRCLTTCYQVIGTGTAAKPARRKCSAK